MLRLIRNEDGVAAVEFVLVLPLLMLMYCGIVEITQAFLADKRVTHVAAAVGDLVAQSNSVTTAQMDDIYDIGADLMRPLPEADLAIRVTNVIIQKGAAKVQWTSGRNASGMSAFSAANEVPTNLWREGQVIIVCETSYSYESALDYVMKDPIVIRRSMRFSPRENNVFLKS
jgi:Flp pilus assembly protein TadG